VAALSIVERIADNPPPSGDRSRPTLLTEQISLQSAADFGAWLDFNGWDSGDYYFCTVDEPLHVRAYVFDYSCENETDPVIYTTVAFLGDALD
jgi:hypothetical protein